MNKGLYLGACLSLLALIFLCLAWELWLAPLRPGGSWLALKALPLLLPLLGVLKRRRYTYQWSSMLILAWPRVGPTGPYQLTRVPVNVKVAVAPAAIAYLAAPPA